MFKDNDTKLLIEILNDIKRYYQRQFFKDPITIPQLIENIEGKIHSLEAMSPYWMSKVVEQIDKLSLIGEEALSDKESEALIATSVCILDSLVEYEISRRRDLDPDFHKYAGMLFDPETEHEAEPDGPSFDEILKVINDSCANYKNNIISIEQLQNDFSWACECLQGENDERVQYLFQIVQKAIEYMQAMIQSKESLLFFSEEKNSRNFILMLLGMIEIKCVEWGAL